MFDKYAPEVCVERQNRIRLSVAAYAYEYGHELRMTDQEFDALSLKIDPSMSTGHATLDRFFKTKFTPHSGMWVQDHPEKDKLKALVLRLERVRRGTKANPQT